MRDDGDSRDRLLALVPFGDGDRGQKLIHSLAMFLDRCAARFVLLGQHPRATGCLQVAPFPCSPPASCRAWSSQRAPCRHMARDAP